MFCLLVWPSVKCDKKGRSMLLLFYFYVNAWNSLHKVNPYICQSGWYLGARFILFFLMNNTHWLFYWIGNISVSVVQKSIQHTSLYSLCLLFPVHFNSFNKKCFFKYYFDISVTCTYMPLVWPFININGFFVLHVHISLISTAGSVPLTKLCFPV